jgi:ribokinase
MPRLAVVGHVEWMRFARVPRLPGPGETVHASEHWEEPGGGGAVAAVQLARLAGEVELFTALADDELGRRARERLEALGVRVHAAARAGAQRHGFAHLVRGGDRAITVVGERMAPAGDDALPWRRLAEADAVYFTAGDVAALRAARRARILVAIPRPAETLLEAGVRLDALVGSAGDPGERLDPARLAPAPAVVVRTEGARGGSWSAADGRGGRWAAAEIPGPRLDAYGLGDCFAAAFTFALADGRALESALELGARAGASKLAGRSPFGGQLSGA